jgi:hypothetical protein
LLRGEGAVLHFGTLRQNATSRGREHLCPRSLRSKRVDLVIRDTRYKKKTGLLQSFLIR